jgi:uncharacterized membrane protein YoaK (UPF0700 family)
MIQIPYLEIGMTVVYATFFFRIAEADRKSRALWTLLSVLLSVLAILGLRWGLAGQLGLQAGLFAAMFVGNVIRARRREREGAGPPP